MKNSILDARPVHIETKNLSATSQTFQVTTLVWGIVLSNLGTNFIQWNIFFFEKGTKWDENNIKIHIVLFMDVITGKKRGLTPPELCSKVSSANF